MMTFQQIIAQWPRLTEFAADVGVKYPTAAAWRQRNSIPPAYWQAVVNAAENRGVEGVTFAELATAAAPKESTA